METEVVKRSVGRPPKPADKVLDSLFKFRVNRFQKERLAEVGTPVQWRSFMLKVALLFQLKDNEQVFAEGVNMDSLRYAIGGLFFDIFVHGKFVEEEENSEGDSEP